MTPMVKEGDKLILRGTHIVGAKAGDVGTKELFEMARELGRQRGVKQVIIEGGRRSSGKYIGKIPRPITINAD